MTTLTDNRDHAHHATSDALKATAESIRDQHRAMIDAQQGAVDAIKSVCHQAVNIAQLVETAHALLGGNMFASWWRDNDLPVGWAKRYLTIARTKGRDMLGDKSQLRLIGILPEATDDNRGHRREQEPMFAWIRWTSKVSQHFRAVDVQSYDEADARAALKHLEPIRAVITQLEASINHDVDTPQVEQWTKFPS